MKTNILITVIGFYVGLIFPVKADYITNEVVDVYNDQTQQVEAQTNSYKMSYVTNFVESPYLRYVNGQLCDTEGDLRWTNFLGKCLAVSDDKITVATFRMLPVYQPVAGFEVTGTITHVGHGAAWTEPAYAPTVTQVQTGERKIDGPIIFLKNEGYALSIGQTFGFRAKCIGIAPDSDGSDPLPLFESGKPYVSLVVKLVKTKI